MPLVAFVEFVAITPFSPAACTVRLKLESDTAQANRSVFRLGHVALGATEQVEVRENKGVKAVKVVKVVKGLVGG